ncbi:MAG: hypothetical protein Q9211_003499 [Gyalolechia sp. 1 TL-2023]
MSLRALRKLQREQEQQKQIQDNRDISEDEASEDEKPANSKTLNAFETLNQAEDQVSAEDNSEQDDEARDTHGGPENQEHEEVSVAQSPSKSRPKPKKRKKSKKKAGHNVRPQNDPTVMHAQKDSAGLDEIDLALKSLSTQSSALGPKPVLPSSHDTFPAMYRLLAIDAKNLNAANEMKRLFGNVVFEGENDEPVQARRRGRVQHLDLGGALAGRNSPISRGQGLAGLALRRNVFMPGKEEWPKAASGGLGMELVEKLNDGTAEYRFVHNTTYQDVQRQFETCVESLDPQRLIHLLQFNPYHISTLLQVSEIAKQQGDNSVSGDLLERALFSFGRSVHSSFITAISEGKARLDFRRPENREFWLAAWRYIANLSQRGTWRTSYEWAKLVLSLDPEGDPYCVALNVDQLALRGGQAEHFLKLCSCSPLDQFLTRPSLRISLALAKYRLKDAQGSRSQLREAILDYPYMFSRLFQELNLGHVPRSIWGQTPRTNREKFDCEVYVHNAKDLWNTPEAISLLVEVAESVERGPDAPKRSEEISLDEARHILLSGTPGLIDLLPRTFTTMQTTSSDPLPPPDSLPSYSSGTGADFSPGDEMPERQRDPAAAAAAVDNNFDDLAEAQELYGLADLFRRFLPRLNINGEGAVQQAAAESGEQEESIRQRGTRLVQLWRRAVGRTVEGLPETSTERTSEPANAAVTEPASADSYASDGEDGDDHLELQDDAPAGDSNRHQPGAASQIPAISQEEPYDDERNQRWLAGQGLIRLRDFTGRHGADENAWGEYTQEGAAVVTEYAARVRQLRQQRTRDFIVNYPLRQGTSVEVRDLVNRYVERRQTNDLDSESETGLRSAIIVITDAKELLRQRGSGSHVRKSSAPPVRGCLQQLYPTSLHPRITTRQTESTTTKSAPKAILLTPKVPGTTCHLLRDLARGKMTNLPYVPVQALTSPTDPDLVYILQPPTSSSSAQLLFLNSTRTIEASSLPLTTITATLPFFRASTRDAYTAAIDGKGNIYAYVGSCDGGANGSDLWVFRSLKEESGLGGQWTKISTSTARSLDTKLTGANHLAAGVAFSITNTTTEMYVFGGMCSNDSATSTEDWTQMASYSNSMLTLEPDASSNSGSYDLGVSPSRGPPIPEAGFTMTPLQPSVMQTRDNRETQQMAQNYVLLGGHTQTAFINMSQVALFSLPEQSWTFLPVDQSADGPETNLAVGDHTVVEPRSGHTAVLSSDGTKVIMYGGWVGDVSTAAQPQLAILELGEGYGGEGDWLWSIPDLASPGPATATGLYGHGAVMLPGDVMMILGGYSIPSTGAPKSKRASLTENTNTYFFNTTSNTWITQYTHPMTEAKRPGSAAPGSQRVTASKRAGLGAGLVFGVLTLLAIVVLYFWYARRLKRRREAREEDLRNLSAGGQRAHWSVLDGDVSGSAMTQRECNNAYPWIARNFGISPSQSADSGPPAQRTGLLFEVPSPTRGLRRSLHSRGAYQPAPRYDDGRLNRSSGKIHPIDERDEYEDEGTKQAGSPRSGSRQQGEYHILRSVPVLDPFVDPAGVSRSPSPQSPARERELEIRKWMDDWAAAADARMHHQAGRVSPDKTDRTSSTLSEQSIRSNWSGHSVGSFSRSLSQRSAAIFSHSHSSTNATAAPCSANEPQNASQSKSDLSPGHRRSQSLTLLPRRATTSAITATGAVSMRQLRQESEALLGGCTDAGPSSPRRAQSRTRGWMGSMRRALGGDRSASASPEHGDSSVSASPIKLQHDTGLPRRAVSAGTALWQKRQGARDWDVESDDGGKTGGGGAGRNRDDEEWDVESAVERRVVQVMFTVPKAKLRVVNGAADGDGESVRSREIHEAEKEPEGKGKAKENG